MVLKSIAQHKKATVFKRPEDILNISEPGLCRVSHLCYVGMVIIASVSLFGLGVRFKNSLFEKFCGTLRLQRAEKVAVRARV